MSCKNAVNNSVKLFSHTLRLYKIAYPDDNSDGEIQEHIRHCTSLKRVRTILIQYPRFQELMSDLVDSGELLHRLMTGRETWAAASLLLVKFFNKLINIIKNPQHEFTWHDEY